MKTVKAKFTTQRAFTLIELLVVISIIGVLAGMTLVVAGSVAKNKKISVARSELETIQLALDNYKAKYGVYPPGNKNVAASGYTPALLSQLYFELSGTSINGADFTTLDGSASIPITLNGKDVKAAYGVGGFINCSKGSGEDAAVAKNFLPGISHVQLARDWTNNGADTTILITSVGGPDDSYNPLNSTSSLRPNPIRYVYPGTNNVGSYDLWVQLVIKGKTNLVCNWSKSVQVNSPLP